MLFALACGRDLQSPLQPQGFGVAYGIWVPGSGDSCPVEVHNRYSTVGPDRKLYPTWHPPVDPTTGCSFGHEHGRDPRGWKSREHYLEQRRAAGSGWTTPLMKTGTIGSCMRGVRKCSGTRTE